MASSAAEYEVQSGDAGWTDKWRYDQAEEFQYRSTNATEIPVIGSLSSQIAKAREDIQNSRAAIGRTFPSTATSSTDLVNRVTKLEGENSTLRKNATSLEKTVAELAARLSALENTFVDGTAAKKTPAAAVLDDEDDDDVDLFGSDEEEEDAEAARVREERLKAYAVKKSAKAGPIAKSSVLLDCKPWDDATDLGAMEAAIRLIQMDGLTWAAARTVPLAYGICKLSILTIVEDNKVSIDDLTETIEGLEEYVQSVDIAAFNKI